MIHAIPYDWKWQIAQLNTRGTQQGDKYWIEIIHETKALSKMIYRKFLPKIPIVENSFQQRWREDLRVNIDDEYLNNCFIQIHKCSISSNIRIFQFRPGKNNSVFPIPDRPIQNTPESKYFIAT